MKSFSAKKNSSIFLLFIFSLIILVVGCTGNNSKKEIAGKEQLREKSDQEKAPVLLPADALKSFKLEKNFSIQLVASEPLVSAPVAINFDKQGRIWAVEMNAYMPDTSGNGEKEPIGKIVILEDKNHDGVMDSRKVFMDSLVLPRAICLFNDGILVAQPPDLWFVENNNDKAGRKYLVDSNYAAGGNVEHQPNGLLRGLDNWIYNAKSATRYRRIGKNKWIKEHTHFRGQWGISQDEFGRMYYNTNSENLLGDYFSPSLGSGNPHQREVAGYNETIVADTRVYPIHPTPGVNRGYMKGVLDDSLRLLNFTAACGPVIYNSEAFGKEYYDNAFVAEPAGNLVKRDILAFEADSTIGREAYDNKEFLASTDERFRPVNLYVGPDKALYVVDMYRGIIQHKTYLTHYLAGEIIKRNLEEPLNCGRIYKIVPVGSGLKAPWFDENKDSLLSFLNSNNAWLRQTAHDFIVDRQLTGLSSALHSMLRSGNNIIGRINVLWVLEGLHQLTKEDLFGIWENAPAVLRQQIITAAIALMQNKNEATFWIQKYPSMLAENTPGLAPYYGYLMSAALKYSHRASDLLLQTAIKYKNNPFVTDAIISGPEDKEEDFLNLYKKTTSDTTDFFVKRLEGVIKNAHEQMLASIADKKMDKNLLEGKALFKINCQVCHGEDGNGIKGLGAPLNGSDWVQGDKTKLLSIVLYGLTGPVKVAGKNYAPPEVAAAMPAMNTNEQLGDREISRIVSYIRNAWNNKASTINEDEVKSVREKYRNREQPFTMKELLRKPAGF